MLMVAFRKILKTNISMMKKFPYTIVKKRREKFRRGTRKKFPSMLKRIVKNFKTTKKGRGMRQGRGKTR
jgi:hypothetical protein